MSAAPPRPAPKRRGRPPPGPLTRAQRHKLSGDPYPDTTDVTPPDWMRDPSLLPRKPPGRSS